MKRGERGKEWKEVRNEGRVRVGGGRGGSRMKRKCEK